jgi:hypothetical protein
LDQEQLAEEVDLQRRSGYIEIFVRGSMYCTAQFVFERKFCTVRVMTEEPRHIVPQFETYLEHRERGCGFGCLETTHLYDVRPSKKRCNVM